MKDINIKLISKPKSKLVKFSGKKAKDKKAKGKTPNAEPSKEAPPKSTAEQQKGDVIATLERELTQMLKFKKDVCDCLGFQSEKIIRQYHHYLQCLNRTLETPMRREGARTT
jgi:hypothetical protein